MQPINYKLRIFPVAAAVEAGGAGFCSVRGRSGLCCLG